MSNTKLFYKPSNTSTPSTTKLLPENQRGKVYADVPLNFFANIDDLKNYVISLKNLGVNVLLILPHFQPSFSAYVVKNFEQPCAIFGTWEKFADFMLFVKELGMDRMIDIPFNHADWQAENIKREWYKNHASRGIEAGADDENADGQRVRVNWGAYELDSSNHEMQNYWLEKVIYPHVEKMHVNAIRIDAAWGLDPEGLKRLVSETRHRCKNVWFLAENLGMSKLIKLAASGIAAGADRFFNNMYWYSGGIYIPTDIYTLYKRSNALPTCTIYSSHDTLMPAMKAYSRLRSADISGLNDKAIVRKFVQYEKLNSLSQLNASARQATVTMMKLDFALAALMSSDVMFAAGSETGLFERIDVRSSGPAEFSRGIESDLPAFMNSILQIKFSEPMFNCESVIVPLGEWKPAKTGVRGYLRSTPDGRHAIVAVNNANSPRSCKLPRRIRSAKTCKFHTIENQKATTTEMQAKALPLSIELAPGQILIISC